MTDPLVASSRAKAASPAAIRVTPAKAMAAASSAMLNTGPRRPREWRRWRMRRSSSVAHRPRLCPARRSAARSPDRPGAAVVEAFSRRSRPTRRSAGGRDESRGSRARARLEGDPKWLRGRAVVEQPLGLEPLLQDVGHEVQGAAAALEWESAPSRIKARETNRSVSSKPPSALRVASHSGTTSSGLRSFGRRWYGCLLMLDAACQAISMSPAAGICVTPRSRVNWRCSRAQQHWPTSALWSGCRPLGIGTRTPVCARSRAPS